MGNINLSKSEKMRLEDFFDNAKRGDNYYVYALCDEGKPFYIGKGISIRCLQHKTDLEAVIDEYKQDVTSEEEMVLLREEIKKELTAKQIRINEAESRNQFDVVIIKFGLTQHEAYMVESAVINSLRFIGVDLTNIVNGHSSKKEKETGEKTKTRYVSQVLSDCCPKEINISDIRKFIEKDSFPFQKEIDEIVFINFNKYYASCFNEDDIWDAVRCCWRMNASMGKKAKYIFAMHNNVIKGIFKVKKDGSTISDYQRIETAETPVRLIDSTNEHVRSKTKEEMDLVGKVIELLKSEPSLSGNHKELYKRINLKNEAFYQRGYFTSDFNEYAADKDLITIKKEFLHCFIKRSDLKMPEGSVTYLSKH